jgi:hypothetical protein
MMDAGSGEKKKKARLLMIIGAVVAAGSIPVYFWNVSVGVIVTLAGGWLILMDVVEILPGKKPGQAAAPVKAQPVQDEEEITVEYLYERIENLHRAVSGLVVSVVGSVVAVFLPIVGGIISLCGFVYALIFIGKK